MDDEGRSIDNVVIKIMNGYGRSINPYHKVYSFCEAQARVRQGSAREGSQGERPQSLKPCLKLTLKLVVTHHHPEVSLDLTNGLK